MKTTIFLTLVLFSCAGCGPGTKQEGKASSQSTSTTSQVSRSSAGQKASLATKSNQSAISSSTPATGRAPAVTGPHATVQAFYDKSGDTYNIFHDPVLELDIKLPDTWSILRAQIVEERNPNAECELAIQTDDKSWFIIEDVFQCNDDTSIQRFTVIDDGKNHEFVELHWRGRDIGFLVCKFRDPAPITCSLDSYTGPKARTITAKEFPQPELQP